ncbi:MAG: ROK family transcriptional regulator [Lentisphaeria bacterium]|nr:ROK family transcriptional regulator [Lentisphaeria bacterium]
MKVAGTSPNVRQCNCNLVKWFLLSNGSATKPEIAEATGISLMTVGKIVNAMLEEGTLRKCGMSETGLGRRAEQFELDGDRSCSVSLRFRDAGVDFVAANEFGTLLREHFAPMPEGYLIPDLAPVLAGFLGGLPALRSAVAGFPAAVFGGRIHSGHLCQFQRVDLQEQLDALFGIPVWMGRDLNLATVGYSRRGLAPMAQETPALQDIACFLLDPSGYGAGCMVGGRVLRGADFFAGEVGRMPLPGGRCIREAAAEEVPDEEYIECVAHLLGAVVCVVNPRAAIFSGRSVRPRLLPEIGRRIRTRIRFQWEGEANVCPELLYEPDIWPDYRAGMVYRATRRLHSGVQMVDDVF